MIMANSPTSALSFEEGVYKKNQIKKTCGGISKHQSMKIALSYLAMTSATAFNLNRAPSLKSTTLRQAHPMPCQRKPLSGLNPVLHMVSDEDCQKCDEVSDQFDSDQKNCSASWPDGLDWLEIAPKSLTDFSKNIPSLKENFDQEIKKKVARLPLVNAVDESKPNADLVNSGSSLGRQLTKALTHHLCRPEREMYFDHWQEAQDSGLLCPGNMVLAPTKVQFGFLTIPTAHYGVVSPKEHQGEWMIYDYHGRRWQEDGPFTSSKKQGEFAFTTLEDFANGIDEQGKPLNENRPITVRQFAPNAERDRRFANVRQFLAHADQIRKNFYQRSSGRFHVLGPHDNNCRRAAHALTHGWMLPPPWLLGFPWPTKALRDADKMSKKVDPNET